MTMIKYFSAAVLLLAIDAAPVTDMKGMVRRQTINAEGDVVTTQPTAPEIQVIQINDKGDSSLVQKSLHGHGVAQPDYGDGDGDGEDEDDGDSAGSECSTDKAFDPKDGGTKKWKGRCKSLAQCQALCTGDCTGFNWWPSKGGCRTNKGAYDQRAVTFTAVGGDATCTLPETTPPTPTTPECDACPSLTGDACRVVISECSTDKAFKKKGRGTAKWQGKCKTFAQCQALCTGDCTAFNWWPGKGGCRTNTGNYKEKTVRFTTIGGSKSCAYSGPTDPTSAECS